MPKSYKEYPRSRWSAVLLIVAIVCSSQVAEAAGGKSGKKAGAGSVGPAGQCCPQKPECQDKVYDACCGPNPVGGCCCAAPSASSSKKGKVTTKKVVSKRK